jgi:periplasmic protein TonB
MIVRVLGRGAAFAFCLFLGATVNVSIFLLLAHMNSPANVSAPEAPLTASLVRIDPAIELEKEAPQEVKEEDYEPQDEELKLEMEVPQEAVDHELMETPLDLTMPSMSAVMVARVRDIPKKTSDFVAPKPAARPRPVVKAVVQGPRRADNVDRPPREHLSNRKPKYPRAALRRRLKGRVIVRLLIDEEGLVKEATVLKVVGPASFAEAVKDVVDNWRFDPAWDKGRFVAVWALKTIQFKPKRT